MSISYHPTTDEQRETIAASNFWRQLQSARRTLAACLSVLEIIKMQAVRRGEFVTITMRVEEFDAMQSLIDRADKMERAA